MFVLRVEFLSNCDKNFVKMDSITKSILFEDKCVGVLLGGCVGDVLGSQNENLSKSEIGEKKIDFPRGCKYTDDTEMTIVLAKHLVENAGSVNLDKVHDEYSKVIKLSSRGYSAKTRSVFDNYGYFTPVGVSPTNGAIMRISPLALVRFSSNEDLLWNVKAAIFCTHGGNQDAVDTAYVYVKLLKALIRDEIKTATEIFNFVQLTVKMTRNASLFTVVKLLTRLNFSEGENLTESIFGYEFMQIRAIECFACALFCFYFYLSDPEEAVIMAANMGGDTDTIAKLTAEMAGARNGMSWIPRRWQHPEGYDILTTLATNLARMGDVEE